MKTDLRPYPEYKESGLPWLGLVPGHWGLRRAKYLLREVDARWQEERGTLLSVSQYTGVTKRRVRDGSDDPDTRAASLVGYKMADAQDLVVNIMLAWNGSLGVAPCEGVVSPAYCIYRFRCGDPWFFHHLLRSPAYRAEIKRRSRGVVESRLRLYTDDLFCIPLLEPPDEEQSVITSYLSDMEHRINRFIRNRRRLIEVLNEQKQAIINRAVTRGLDRNVPLKPSGIKWVGMVPRPWRTLALKRVCRVQGGYAFRSSTFRHTGVAVVRMNNLRRGVLDLSDAAHIPEDSCLADFELASGDLLYGLSGSIGVTGSLGNFAVVRQCDLPAQLNQRVARFRPNRAKIDSTFLGQVIQTPLFYEQVLFDTTGTAQFNVSTRAVENVVIPLPPIEEQRIIADELMRRTAGLQRSIAHTQREIDLIREYRTRLIADVVTGKVDVRHLAPAPGEEIIKPEPEDLAEGIEDDETQADDEPELVEEADDAQA